MPSSFSVTIVDKKAISSPIARKGQKLRPTLTPLSRYVELVRGYNVSVYRPLLFRALEILVTYSEVTYCRVRWMIRKSRIIER